MIDVMLSGPFTTVQDMGRQAYLDQGISQSGAMDRAALQLANLLVGNAAGTAAIETAGAVLKLKVEVETAIAVTGAPVAVSVDGCPVPMWWAEPLTEGQVIEVKPAKQGTWSYIAFAGGIDCPPALGSRSTDAKVKIGGPFEGAALAHGHNLSLGDADAAHVSAISKLGGFGVEPLVSACDQEGATEIRVLPAREYQDFDDASQAGFWGKVWTVSPASNRQGFQLAGDALILREPLSLTSYGLIPGTIQVPPAGQPVVQLAEANTCGGYPKIGVVLETDLRLLSQTRPGETVRMRQVTRGEALTARAEAAEQLKQRHKAIESVVRWT